MTEAEKRNMENLTSLVRQIREDNKEFRATCEKSIDDINSKVERKFAPLYFEADILSTVQSSIAAVISETLKGWNSPMNKIIQSVVDENYHEIRRIISEGFTATIRTSEFKQSVINAFSHKIARLMISSNDALFDKVASDLKQDSVFKSKMAIAISIVVEEILSERNNSEKL